MIAVVFLLFGSAACIVCDKKYDCYTNRFLAKQQRIIRIFWFFRTLLKYTIEAVAKDPFFGKKYFLSHLATIFSKTLAFFEDLWYIYTVKIHFN